MLLRPTRGRLVLLAGASLLPLAVLLIQFAFRADLHVLAVVLAEAITILLVLARMTEQLATERQLAIHDGLTGAYTADFLTESVRMECDRARYLRGELGVLLIDVDNVALVNEMYGSTAGDIVLNTFRP